MMCGRPELTCREVVELVTDYLEDALPAAERERFDAHVASCPGCRAYLAQMRVTLQVVAATAEFEAPPEVPELMTTFRTRMRNGSPARP
jgi:anti-sigma factor RsiW